MASKELSKKVDAVIAADSTKTPHIERKGIAYRELNNNNEILPKQSNLIHFEPDAVTPAPTTFTSSSKIDFRFERYQEVMADWKNNVSDHCPVKIWF